jgi:hypothetical protein
MTEIEKKMLEAAKIIDSGQEATNKTRTDDNNKDDVKTL